MSLPKNTCGVQYTSLAALNTSDLLAVPDRIAMRRSFQFPMDMATAEAAFPIEYEVAGQVTPNNGGVVNGVLTESGLMGGTNVFCPFIVCGFCISITANQKNFAVNGAIVDRTATGVGATPPEYSGTVPVTGETGMANGTYSYGQDAQEIALQLLLAYKLRFMLQCKYELFSVPLADIGCVEDPAACEGFSGSNVAVDPYTAELNRRYQTLGSNLRFLSPNRFSASGTPTVFTEQALRPTVNAANGGLSNRDGKWNGFYACQFPILLTPCCRFNLALVADGPISQQALGKILTEAKVTEARAISPEWISPPADEPLGLGSQLVHHMHIGDLIFDISMIGYNVEAAMCQEYAQSPAIPADYINLLNGMGAFGTSVTRLARARSRSTGLRSSPPLPA